MANTNDMNTPTKVPCGGFVLGEGLALSKDGKTLNVTGGGGSQADWTQNDTTAKDYVKNRPFYTGDPVETVFVEESTVKFADQDGFYTAPFPSSFNAEFGQTYKISWDGIVYTCTCESFNNLPSIGNQSIVGVGTDTGEPFIIYNRSGLQKYGWVCGTIDTSDSHTISISGFAQEIVKIDEKYLPKYFVLYNDDPANWSNAQKQQMYDDFISGKLLLYKYPANADTVGAVLSVFYSSYGGLTFVLFDSTGRLIQYNGSGFSSVELSEYGINSLIKDYIQKLQRWKLFDNSDPSSELAVGDLINMFIGFDSTTKKACILTQTKENGGISHRNYTIVTNGDSDITLSSSTPDSTKKFKITVDDTGTIKATEVTNN